MAAVEIVHEQHAIKTNVLKRTLNTNKSNNIYETVAP